MVNSTTKNNDIYGIEEKVGSEVKDQHTQYNV